MGKIRILIVDDAVVVRRLLSDALSGDPALQVVGTAANGRIALAKIPHVNPDVVILDVEMPDMDGLQTLAALRKGYPRLPVIMFSQYTQRGAAATLDALAMGATDYLSKPEPTGSTAAAAESIRAQLIPKIKELASPGRKTPSSAGTAAPAATPANRPLSQTGLRLQGRVQVVAIGASTGGPTALATVLAAFPDNCPVPTVIVQHMPPMFTRLLAERLSSQSRLLVTEAASGATLAPGRAWLAPGDYHLVLTREADTIRLRLHQGPPENSCRPSVDVLFSSVAEVYGASALAVVLTGMGQDGLRGCERIREAGGRVLVQDAATSIVWGMPKFVAKAGLADEVLPLDELGPAIVRRIWRGRTPTHREVQAANLHAQPADR
jgi:two-component system chemotaxis response regulator CheB